MSNNIRPRACRECGTSFPGGPRAWYCPKCREIRRKARDKRIKQDGPKRPLGSTDLCTVCGGTYIVNSGRQRYCPGCAPAAIKEVDNRQGIEWYRANRDTYNPTRNATRRKGECVCVICWTRFPSDGTARDTCSKGCRDMQKKEAQNRADKKRSPRKKEGG